jgi:hypothetical protein
MTNALHFPLADVLSVAEASESANEHTSGFADTEAGVETGPAIIWVKDAGTYLMSNAIPRSELIIYGRAHTPDGLLLKQPDDSSDPGWDEVWHETRAICGGDDFAEYFKTQELLPAIRQALADDYTHLVIVVDENTLDLGFEKCP